MTRKLAALGAVAATISVGAVIAINPLSDAAEAPDVAQAASVEVADVDYATYRGALERTIECARDAGVVVDDLQPSWDGVTLTYAFHDAPGALEAHDTCYVEHAAGIDRTWQLSDAVEAERGRVVDAIAACLSAAGEPATGDLEAVFHAGEHAPEVFERCVGEHRAEPSAIGR
jgi:hypothetical protein